MKFGTFYSFQATPGQRHADIIGGELDQIEWTEELGFDEIWLRGCRAILSGECVAVPEQAFYFSGTLDDVL